MISKEEFEEWYNANTTYKHIKCIKDIDSRYQAGYSYKIQGYQNDVVSTDAHYLSMEELISSFELCCNECRGYGKIHHCKNPDSWHDGGFKDKNDVAELYYDCRCNGEEFDRYHSWDNCTKCKVYE